ncbi:AEC family transporter [Gammaproteobacteria bacterium AS21]|jgi:predicted permease
MLSTLANPILPIFAILMLGYIFFHIKLFDVVAAQAINKFVFYVATPALVFNVVSNAPINTLDFTALGLYFVAQLTVYVAVFLLLMSVFHLDKKEALLLGLTTVFVNHIFFVLPIAERVYGKLAAQPIAGIVIVDIIVLFCGTVLALDLMNSSKKSVFKVLVLLSKNPFLIAAVIGACSLFFKESVPEGVITYAQFAGAAAAPASLFSLGIILASNTIKTVGKEVWVVVVMNIVAMPLLVISLAELVTVSAKWQQMIILMAAGPCGAMPFVIALQYGIRTQLIAKAILISTVLSLVTLTILTNS